MARSQSPNYGGGTPHHHGNLGPFSNHSSSKKIPQKPPSNQRASNLQVISGSLASHRSVVKNQKVGMGVLSPSMNQSDEKIEMISVQPAVELKFNIKITDLSDLENPFVIYEHKKIDEDGYIIFENLNLNSENNSAVNPLRILPWLASPGSTLEKRTLKIEVTYLSELVLLRFIHLDRFYPLKYP